MIRDLAAQCRLVDISTGGGLTKVRQTPIDVVMGFGWAGPQLVTPVLIPLIPSLANLFLDASGEAGAPLPVPTFVPQGMSATFQALVYNPANRAVGFTLGNPIAVIAK